MSSEAREYLLKEYGSWSVLTIAFLIGLGVSHDYIWTIAPLFLALGLLVNSKQAFMKWLRKTSDKESLIIFSGQIITATVILAAIFRSDIPRLLPLLIFPAAYMLSNKLAGEHFVITEVLGFALLSLSAVLVKFLLTGGLDARLFIGVALYFTAGVFKIKAMLLKKILYRAGAVLYVLFALYLYHRFDIAAIILLPLFENVIMSATLYKVKLQTTGWIEVAKSLAFLGLFIAWY
jgi:hypothetical protein